MTKFETIERQSDAIPELTKAVIAADKNREKIMDEVRDGLYAYGDLEHLALLTGKSSACLYSIRAGRTKWPRWHTLLTLIPHLGLELTLRRITNSFPQGGNQ